MPLLWTETLSAESSRAASRPATLTEFPFEPRLPTFLALIRIIQATTPCSAVKSKLSPFDDGRPPGQTGAEGDEQDQVTALDHARGDGLVQRDDDRRGG